MNPLVREFLKRYAGTSEAARAWRTCSSWRSGASFGLTYSTGSIEAIEAAVAAGDPAAAIHAALVGTGVATRRGVRSATAEPSWPKIDGLAPTLPRECRVEHQWSYGPGQFASISAPTLLLTGSETDPRLSELIHRAVAAIPGSPIRVLEGHGHFAFKTDPAMVAGIIREFMAA